MLSSPRTLGNASIPMIWTDKVLTGGKTAALQIPIRIAEVARTGSQPVIAISAQASAITPSVLAERSAKRMPLGPAGREMDAHIAHANKAEFHFRSYPSSAVAL